MPAFSQMVGCNNLTPSITVRVGWEGERNLGCRSILIVSYTLQANSALDKLVPLLSDSSNVEVSTCVEVCDVGVVWCLGERVWCLERVNVVCGGVLYGCEYELCVTLLASPL